MVSCGRRPRVIEAARIDGANAFQRFVLVRLPLLRPVIAVVVLQKQIVGGLTFGAVKG